MGSFLQNKNRLESKMRKCCVLTPLPSRNRPHAHLVPVEPGLGERWGQQGGRPLAEQLSPGCGAAVGELLPGLTADGTSPSSLGAACLERGSGLSVWKGGVNTKPLLSLRDLAQTAPVLFQGELTVCSAQRSPLVLFRLLICCFSDGAGRP